MKVEDTWLGSRIENAARTKLADGAENNGTGAPCLVTVFALIAVKSGHEAPSTAVTERYRATRFRSREENQRDTAVTTRLRARVFDLLSIKQMEMERNVEAIATALAVSVNRLVE